MPEVKVCFWNIQNYGSGAAGVGHPMQRKWGPASGLRNRFIATLMHQQAVDVLWIMEASSGAIASLQDLVARLNHAYGTNDWAMAMAGSGLDFGSPNPPTAPGHITYRSDGRSEGYAVLWRTGQHPRFRVLNGLHDLQTALFSGPAHPLPPVNSPINFTTFGRPAGMTPEPEMGGRKRGRESEYLPLGGFEAPGTLPYGADGEELAAWPALPMPTTGSMNPDELAMHRVRRAAYVVLALGADAILCPVSVYHAPSAMAKAQWGAMQAALGRDLYVTNALTAHGQPDPAVLQYAARALIGGDFNYKVTVQEWPQLYQYFVQPMDHGSDGGADMRPTPAGRGAENNRKTTVRLLEGWRHDQVITSGNVDDYLALQIDLVFWRSIGSAVRVNVPQLLLGAGTRAAYAPTLQALHARLTAFTGGLAAGQRMNANNHGPERFWTVRGVPQTAPLLSSAWGGTFVHWDDFMASLNLGEITGTPRVTAARQAAELYTIFVSDHLPLVATITF